MLDGPSLYKPKWKGSPGEDYVPPKAKELFFLFMFALTMSWGALCLGFFILCLGSWIAS